jgi:serine/threonine-protein kinase
MAQVFLARVAAAGVSGFEKLVVIKKILPHLAEDEYFVERFLDEGKIVVKLSHGSIAQVLDMGQEGEEYYIAMEFVDGKDLRKIAARCRDQKLMLPTGLALYIFARLLDALAYAHRKKDEQDRDLNVVHRDISPQNILVSYEGEVKIIDFGLAKSALSLTRTSPSVILGKFFYMSPEQARHQPADRRSDLYAAGICLWEVLAGRNPFDETPPGEILRVVANPQIPHLREICPDLSEDLYEIVMRALAPDPAQRFQTAEEMRGRVNAAMLQADPAAGPEALAAFMRQRFEKEYDNERKTIAFLSKLPPPEAPAEEREEKEASARPTPDPESTPTPAAFDNPPNSDRDVTATGPPEEEEDEPGPGGRPTLRLTGPVFGGAAEEQARRPKPRPPPEEADSRRSTLKVDPLEFVLGEGTTPAPVSRKEPDRKAARPAPAPVRSAPKPARTPRRSSKEVPVAAAPAMEPTVDPSPPTPPSIIISKELEAAAEPSASVLVSPELLAESVPSPRDAESAVAEGTQTPAIGMPALSPGTTPRGTELDAPRGSSSALTILLVVVGFLCIITAAAIAILAFRPAWLGMGPAPTGRVMDVDTLPTDDKPAPGPQAEPPPAAPAASAPSAPSARAAETEPAPAAEPKALADASDVPEMPDPPVKKARLTKTEAEHRRAEAERRFNSLETRYLAIESRFPTRIARLTKAHATLSEKRALLDDPRHFDEFDAWLNWFTLALDQTRQNLEP